MKKANKRIVSTALAIMLLLACVCPASAATETQVLALANTMEYPDGIFAELIITDRENVYVLPNTNTVHVAGKKDIITINENDEFDEQATASFGCNAALGLGANIDEMAHNAIWQHLTVDVGLTDYEDYSVLAGDMVEIKASAASGTYCAVVAFPGKTVTKSVKCNTSFGAITRWSEEIDYAPIEGAAGLTVRLAG